MAPDEAECKSALDGRNHLTREQPSEGQEAKQQLRKRRSLAPPQTIRIELRGFAPKPRFLVENKTKTTP